jgi:hypothetical protein
MRLGLVKPKILQHFGAVLEYWDLDGRIVFWVYVVYSTIWTQKCLMNLPASGNNRLSQELLF